MEGVPRLRNVTSREEINKSFEQLADELRRHVRDNVIRLKELRQKGQEALKIAWKQVNDGMLQYSELTNPNQKANLAIMELSKEIQDKVLAHGVASNIPIELLQDEEKRKNFPIDALVNILATGIVKGDCAPLSGGFNQNVFTDAPFILLSNKDENLFAYDAQGVNHLKGLRTVLVNGQYESMIDDFKKAFPGVSFRKSDELNDRVFDKKESDFVSYDEQIQIRAKQEYEARLRASQRK